MFKSKFDFFVQKVLELFLTIFFVTIISFVLMRLSPIDPAEAYVRRSMAAYSADKTYMDEMREKMGLNKSLHRQYIDWLKKAIKGDFGTSFVTGKVVLNELKTALMITLKIVLISGIIQIIFIYIFSIILYLAGENLLAKLINFLCIVGLSVPPFFLAGLYIDVFALKYKLVSVAGNTGILGILPASIVLAIGCIAFFVPLLTNALRREMKSEAANYARFRGISEIRILYKYAMPTSLASLLPSFFQMLGLCLVGSAIIERVFSLSGIGYLIIESVLYRDVPIIHATVLFLALIFVFLNILSEVLAIIIVDKN